MISPRDLEGQTIAVMGLGKSGLATLRALADSGTKLIAWDDDESARTAAANLAAAEDLAKADWTRIDALVLSPGIPHTLPEPHPVAAQARKHGVEIIGDAELLFRHYADRPRPRMVAVTGTNGKSTTTALIAHILQGAGRKVQAGGNLGTPVLSFGELGEDGFYVIEMSSFQCELTPSAAFDAVAWLNITPDHFDRHGGMQGYVNAKKNLLRNVRGSPLLAIGVDDDESLAVAEETAKKAPWRVTPFGASRILDKGVSGVNGTLYAGGKRLFSIENAAALPGAHNAQNAAAAFAICRELGLSDAEIEKGILSYPGLAHRQQLVRKLDGVRFVNDSKATNAEAASKALACYDVIYWIAGGKPKDGGLSGLEGFMPRIRHAFLVGEASGGFADWLQGKADFTRCGTLDRAVEAAARRARADGIDGAVVLLSPACASYDQFRSYEHRGEEFARLVAARPTTEAGRAA